LAEALATARSRQKPTPSGHSSRGLAGRAARAESHMNAGSQTIPGLRDKRDCSQGKAKTAAT